MWHGIRATSPSTYLFARASNLEDTYNINFANEIGQAQGAGFQNVDAIFKKNYSYNVCILILLDYIKNNNTIVHMRIVSSLVSKFLNMYVPVSESEPLNSSTTTWVWI